MVGIGVAVKKLDGQLDAGAWTPVIPSWRCDHVLVKNQSGGVLRLRTDPDDETTELPIGAGLDQPFVAPYSGRGRRFQEGETVFWLQPETGTGEGITLIWI